jgi:hypothetical protein
VVSTLITEEDLCDVATTPPVRSCANPLLCCRPKGYVSRFWVVSDDEFSDADSGLSTLEMVRQAAVHGFSKEDLVSISKNLNCPTILSRACASVSPSSCEETFVKQARKFFDSWVEPKKRTCGAWKGSLPPRRVSPKLTLSDCVFQAEKSRAVKFGRNLGDFSSKRTDIASIQNINLSTKQSEWPELRRVARTPASLAGEETFSNFQ